MAGNLSPRMKYWLMKSEPDECSIDDVLAAPGRITPWSGVRNYQARNFMRDAMRVGDGVLFYHSSCAEPGIAGLAEVASPAYPDATQFDRKSRKVSVSIKALEVQEEKEAIAQYGSSDSGATLGDILGTALKRATEDKEKTE